MIEEDRINNMERDNERLADDLYRMEGAFQEMERTLVDEAKEAYAIIDRLESTLAEKGATIEELKKEIERLKKQLVELPITVMAHVNAGGSDYTNYATNCVFEYQMMEKKREIDSLQSELTALRDQLRWVPITEGLPEKKTAVLFESYKGAMLLGAYLPQKGLFIHYPSDDLYQPLDVKRYFVIPRPDDKIEPPSKEDGK